jgi:hypothetical protein
MNLKPNRKPLLNLKPNTRTISLPSRQPACPFGVPYRCTYQKVAHNTEGERLQYGAAVKQPWFEISSGRIRGGLYRNKFCCSTALQLRCGGV